MLERGANPNLQDEEGRSALMRSTSLPEVVRLLLKHGADPHLRSRNAAAGPGRSMVQTLISAALRANSIGLAPGTADSRTG